MNINELKVGELYLFGEKGKGRKIILLKEIDKISPDLVVLTPSLKPQDQEEVYVCQVAPETGEIEAALRPFDPAEVLFT